jgi:aryl-alcohol dehydrogenase-like predicted oxidoreductase
MSSARIRLGASSLTVAPLALGTWAWGDKPYWGYESTFTAGDVVDAYVESVDAGIDLIDTAEVYGHGASEQIVGYLARRDGRTIQVASKFALLRGRDGARALSSALDASLRRLRLPRVDLYQVHWCDTSMASIESLMDAMADAVDAGKVGAVGVSNFSASELRDAHAALARRGLPLASNQVRYSLLHRAPERDGVLDACRELGVTLLAYSPLDQGALTGKYGRDRIPSGPRATLPSFSTESLEHARTVVALLRAIGARHDATPSQVALEWLMGRGVVPIAGAKTGAHALENAGAMRVTLEGAEVDEIDRATRAFV